MNLTHLDPRLINAPSSKGNAKPRSALELLTMLETRFPEKLGNPSTSDAELRYWQGVRTVVLVAREFVYGGDK